MGVFEWFGFVAILAAAAAAPGPDVAAIVARGLSHGFARTLPLLAGITIGNCCWMLGAATGIAALAQALGPAFIVIKLIALGYLLYLAWTLWRAPVDADADGAQSRHGGLMAGLLVSASNPKALAFFGAVLPSVLPIARFDWTDIATMIAIGAATLICVHGSWAWAAGQARHWLTRPAQRRRLNRLSAVMMAGTGVAAAAR